MFESCIAAASLMFGVEIKVIESIIEIESSFRSQVVGTSGEIGLMQVMPKYSKEPDLFDPCKNIREGTRILAEAKKYCKFKQAHSYVVCYNYGVTGAKKLASYNVAYYRKFMATYKRRLNVNRNSHKKTTN